VPVLNPDGTPTTRRAAVGAQVFPGFRPSDAGTHSRNNVAAYVDLESDVVSRVLLGVAGRYEHYSDFGSTTTGKVAGRFQAAPGVALRGAVSSGFKAPSLAQSYFSSTATNFIGGVPFDVRTFPVRTAEAQVLGASPLTPEKSLNYSAGIALEPAKSFATTVDFYWIEINDRIVLSENFTGAAVQALFTQRGLAGVSGGRFFTNAIDTRSHGVDVVANYGVTLINGAVLRLTGSYNANRTRVTQVDTNPTALAAFSEALFGRVERARIEKGQPRDNVIFSANYNQRALGLVARTQRFGSVTSYGTPRDGSLDQTFRAKWITDVSAAYTLRQRYTLTVGADNVFDIYPDRNNNPGNPATGNGGNANFGIFPYSGISPFGFNGRFVYTKVTLTF
jgi:iron complex outermembrane receptor protein